MASRKVSLDSLGSEIEKILNEYQGEVQENLDVITKKVGQKGAQALRNESLSTFADSKKHKTRYGNTWTSKTEKGRLYTKVIIYSRMPGLPHLLENGHAKVNGGRVPGKAHIAPVESRLVREYESEVASKL